VPDQIKFDEPETQGHVWRSQMLDQFARIEDWVSRCAGALGEKPSKASLGQKLKVIRAATARFKKPKRIEELTGRIEKAIELRNDLTHSLIVTVLDRSGTPLWLFRNVGHVANSTIPRSALLSAEDFKCQIADLKNLVKELNDQQLSPPAPTVP
jgi:hypothetical protein